MQEFELVFWHNGQVNPALKQTVGLIQIIEEWKSAAGINNQSPALPFQARGCSSGCTWSRRAGTASRASTKTETSSGFTDSVSDSLSSGSVQSKLKNVFVTLWGKNLKGNGYWTWHTWHKGEKFPSEYLTLHSLFAARSRCARMIIIFGADLNGLPPFVSWRGHGGFEPLSGWITHVYSLLDPTLV